MLTSFRSCPEKFRNEFIWARSPREVSPDLHAGGAFSAGIETIRKAYYDYDKPLDEAIVLGFVKFSRFWEDYEPAPKRVAGRETSHPKNFVNTWAALVDYFREYPPDEDKLQPWRTKEVSPFEMSFAFPVPEVLHPITKEPFFYCGRFDMIGEYNKFLYIVDEKTATSLGDSWFRQWDMRGQFIGYVWALRRIGLPCIGAIIRGIAIQKTMFTHGEAIVTYEEFQLNRWYRQLVRDLHRISVAFETNEWDWNYGEACNQYWGCPFKIMCTSKNPKRWESNFTTRRWNPLDKDPTETRLFKPKIELVDVEKTFDGLWK